MARFPAIPLPCHLTDAELNSPAPVQISRELREKSEKAQVLTQEKRGRPDKYFEVPSQRKGRPNDVGAALYFSRCDIPLLNEAARWHLVGVRALQPAFGRSARRRLFGCRAGGESAAAPTGGRACEPGQLVRPVGPIHRPWPLIARTLVCVQRVPLGLSPRARSPRRPSRGVSPCACANGNDHSEIPRLAALSPVPVPENAVARHGESSTCGSPPNASAAADG